MLAQPLFGQNWQTEKSVPHLFVSGAELSWKHASNSVPDSYLASNDCDYLQGRRRVGDKCHVDIYLYGPRGHAVPPSPPLPS